jgi:ATP-dependent Lon protease, bacterial type
MILPLPNKKDLVDIPQKIREEMEFIFVEDIKEVFKEALAAPLGGEKQDKKRASTAAAAKSEKKKKNLHPAALG